MKKVTKFFRIIVGSIQELKTLIQKYPQTSALIIGILWALAVSIVFALELSLPKDWNFDAIAELLFNCIFLLIVSVCVGGLFFWASAEIFGEKKYQELRQATLKSQIKLIINTGLIESGAAKTADNLIK